MHDGVIMNEEILEITCSPPPFGADDKIFYFNDEDGMHGEPFSLNDFYKQIFDIAGINENLLGK